ncbi:hypothetical protein ScPMuIL_003108 [Solemya velum]
MVVASIRNDYNIIVAKYMVTQSDAENKIIYGNDVAKVLVNRFDNETSLPHVSCLFSQVSHGLDVAPPSSTVTYKYVRTNKDVELGCPAPSGVAGVSWHYQYLDGTSPDYPDIASRDTRHSSFKHSDRILLTHDTVKGVYTITLQAFDGPTDQGRYQCRWLGGDHTFIVKLAYGPTSAIISVNNPLLTGKEETLTCKASSVEPGVNFQWSKDGIPIEGVGKNILTLTPVYTDNGASITCVATNTKYSDLTASDTITLNVQYGARATTITAPSVVTEDPIGGDYRCTAANSRGGERTQSTYIKVQFPPDVSVSVTENDTAVVFTCFPKGEPQNYKFSSWKHISPDGNTIIRQLHAESGGSLTLSSPVTYEDSGYYKCTVNNGVTGRSSQLDHIGESGYFSVGGPPKIGHNEVEGLSLKVWFVSDPEYTSVQWYIVDGNTVSNINSQSGIEVSTQTTDSVEMTFHNKKVLVPGYITTLTFKYKSAAEFRTYRLRVDNIKGHKVFVKEIGEILGFPEVPVDDSGSVNVVIGVASAVVVTVLIILFVIVVVLWLRGIKPPCLRKPKETTNNYQNQAFNTANVTNTNDSVYQDLGPTENLSSHYQELSEENTVLRRNPNYGSEYEEPDNHESDYVEPNNHGPEYEEPDNYGSDYVEPDKT